MNNLVRSSHGWFLGILTALLMVSTSTGLGGKMIPLIPTKGTPVKVSSNGKQLTYYLASRDVPLEIEADGPGKITVLSRFVYGGGESGSQRYVIRILENGQEVKSYSTQTEPSEVTLSGTGEKTGKSRKCIIQVPEGSHTYSLTLDGAPHRRCLVKFRFQPSKGVKSLVTIEPLTYHKVVTLLSGDKLIAYYVTSRDHQVHIRVVGPTRLKVSSRLNYDAVMKGEQRYAVSVVDGENKVLTKKLATTKAVGASFKDWQEMVPGKENSFYLTVPPGEHTYKFLLDESIAKTLSLKFSIPKKDLENED